jgi:hypothetical protein
MVLLTLTIRHRTILRKETAMWIVKWPVPVRIHS